jgi:hypothetical protein
LPEKSRTRVRGDLRGEGFAGVVRRHALLLIFFLAGKDQ